MGKTELSPGTRIRNAALLERFHISLTALGCDTCVAASASYSSTTAVLDYATARRALKRMTLAHPALCVQIAGEHDKKPYFVRLPTVNVDDVLEYSTDVTKTVEDVMTTALLTPFETNIVPQPLWRVTVRNDQTVIFSWHHSIGDGGCAHSFHAAFLSALNHQPDVDESDSGIVNVPENITLAPTIEEKTDISVSFKTTLHTLYEVFAPASWQPLRHAWTGNSVVPTPQIRSEVRIRKVAPDEARKLVALCRAHKCTITSFYHTLAVYVLSHQVADLENASTDKKKRQKKYKTLVTSVPISLRRFTGVGPLEFCDQVTTYHYHPPIIRDIPQYPPTVDTFPWQLATEYMASLHGAYSKSREVIGTIRFIYKLGLSKSYYLDQLGKKREVTLVLSNIGVMPKNQDADEKQQGKEEKWGLDDIGFGQNDTVLGSAMKINMAGSPSGAISVIYTWGTTSLDLKFAETFIAEMQAAVAAILA